MLSSHETFPSGYDLSSACPRMRFCTPDRTLVYAAVLATKNVHILGI